MTAYDEAMTQLQALHSRLVQDTEGVVDGVVHSYEVPTRDLCAVLLQLFTALGPPKP